VSYLGTGTIKYSTEIPLDRKVKTAGRKVGSTLLVQAPKPNDHSGDNFFYFIDSSNSFIQSRFLRTSRGFAPSGGPTMPSFSMRSIRRAARP